MYIIAHCDDIARGNPRIYPGKGENARETTILAGLAKSFSGFSRKASRGMPYICVEDSFGAMGACRQRRIERRPTTRQASLQTPPTSCSSIILPRLAI